MPSVLLGAVILASASVIATTWATDGWATDESEPAVVSESDPPQESIQALLLGRDTPRLPDLPAEAEEIVADYDKAAAEIRRKAALEIRRHRLEAMRRLKTLQDEHTRSARLDEAVAIRDTIRQMLQASFATIDNPGSMQAYANKLNSSFLVRVTGRTTGSIYGTDYYTYDSDVATASVHSGALRDGQTGVVVITMISAGEPHIGSTRNGVRSYDWGTYPASYTVRRWKPSPEEIELGSIKLE